MDLAAWRALVDENEFDSDEESNQRAASCGQADDARGGRVNRRDSGPKWTVEIVVVVGRPDQDASAKGDHESPNRRLEIEAVVCGVTTEASTSNQDRERSALPRKGGPLLLQAGVEVTIGTIGTRSPVPQSSKPPTMKSTAVTAATIATEYAMT